MKKKVSPLTYGTHCGECPFSRNSEPYMPVMAEGPLTAQGALWGESPGKDEAERERPFIGPTGQKLDDQLLAVKLRRSDLYVGNAMCCPPPIGKTLAMMRQAADCCRPATIAQLSQLSEGLHVLAMGKFARYSLTGKIKGLKNGRGFLEEWSLDDARKVGAVFAAKLEKEERAKQRKMERTRGAKINGTKHRTK